jgi:hypothetical protein
MDQASRSIFQKVGGLAIGCSLLFCPLWTAGAALSQNLRKCPVESGNASEIAEAVRAAPSCAQSYEVMNVCRGSADGDLALANIVVEKCEQVFAAPLDPAALKSYSAARENCARRFVKKDANSLSNQAACEAGVAVVFAHRADLEAMRAQRAANRPRPPGAPAANAPAPAPFGGMPAK